MKKLIAILAALILAIGMTAAVAEETSFTIRNNVTFGMSMEEVIATETVRYHEIDNEHTHGPVNFMEVEYEHVKENGIPVEVKYLFIGNELVAVRFCYETRDTSFDRLKADLSAKYGEFVPADQIVSALGNGIYAVDDDGRLEHRAEGTVNNTLAVVLEADEDDLEVTFVDLSAAYIMK